MKHGRKDADSGSGSIKSENLFHKRSQDRWGLFTSQGCLQLTETGTTWEAIWDVYTYTHTDAQTSTETHKQAHRHTDRDKQTDHTNVHRHTDKHMDTQTHIQTCTY